MHNQLQAMITVLSLISPAICAAMFGWEVAEQSQAVLSRKEST